MDECEARGINHEGTVPQSSIPPDSRNNGIKTREMDSNSPVDHLNTTLESIIEMSLSTSTSKDLCFDN